MLSIPSFGKCVFGGEKDFVCFMTQTGCVGPGLGPNCLRMLSVISR